MSNSYKDLFIETSHVLDGNIEASKKNRFKFLEAVEKFDISLKCMSENIFQAECEDELKQIAITITITFTFFFLIKALIKLLRQIFQNHSNYLHDK